MSREVNNIMLYPLDNIYGYATLGLHVMLGMQIHSVQHLNTWYEVLFLGQLQTSHRLTRSFSSVQEKPEVQCVHLVENIPICCEKVWIWRRFGRDTGSGKWNKCTNVEKVFSAVSTWRLFPEQWSRLGKCQQKRRMGSFWLLQSKSRGERCPHEWWGPRSPWSCTSPAA